MPKSMMLQPIIIKQWNVTCICITTKCWRKIFVFGHKNFHQQFAFWFFLKDWTNQINLQKQVSNPLIETTPHLKNLYLITTNNHQIMKHDMHVYHHQRLFLAMGTFTNKCLLILSWKTKHANLKKQVSNSLIETAPHLTNLYLITTNNYQTMKHNMHVYHHKGLKEKFCFWPQ